MVFIDALHHRTLPLGGVGETTGVMNHVSESRMVSQFEDRRIVDAAGHRDQRANRRHVNYVTWQELDIFGLVAIDQQIVKIEVGYGFGITPDLNVAQGAVFGWPARGEERVHQGAQRADGVSSWPLYLAHDVNLHGAQPAHAHAKLEILVITPYLPVEVIVQLFVAQAGDIENAHSGYVNGSRSIDDGANIGVDLAPSPNHQF